MWYITLQLIVIEFLLQTDLSEDFLTVYDGSNDESIQIAKLSGYLGSTFSISSTGKSLFVQFESDHYDDGSTGFLATVYYGIYYISRIWNHSEGEIQFLILFL